MEELLKNYSLSDIILFIIFLAAAIKGVVSFCDWASKRLKQKYESDFEEETEQDTVLSRLNKHDEQFKIILDALNKNNEMISNLIDSDKDDIKAWITERHHYFCYEKKMIDDYSLDGLERRFKHYRQEGGNSYVETLMDEIRALPKVSIYTDLNEKKPDEKKGDE